MKVPFIDLLEQHKTIREEIKSAVNGVLDSQQFILKERVSRLEKEIAIKMGVKYALGVASGSDALYLSLAALGVGAGDEVVTSPFTFFATAGAIVRTGAIPVFADISSETFNLDADQLKSKLTKRTKAVIPVHLFGLCCDMEPLLKFAKQHSLYVVEDAAQAFGSVYHGRMAGAMGDAGCLSFFPTKNLGAAGDAGMVTTSSATLAEKIKLLRVHGSRKKYYHEAVGINSRLDELQAAVLLVKLRYVDQWNEARQKCAADYNDGFKGLPLVMPIVPDGYKHTFHLYSVLTDKRDALKEYLAQKGIGTAVYYPLPLHLQPCFRELGYSRNAFPVSERTADRILSLPMYPELSKAQKRLVIRLVRTFFNHA